MLHLIQIAVIVIGLCAIIWRMACDLRTAWPGIVRLVQRGDPAPVLVRYCFVLPEPVQPTAIDRPERVEILLAA